MPIFALAIFLSAFLLFQVQPLIARYILPWYGGSPTVWTTCLLFFQCGLLGGYAYAHALVTFLRERRKLQIGIHLVLLAVALIALPVTPEEGLKPAGALSNPIPGILKLLTFAVGLPYFLLSASGPLLQHWFAESYPDRSPYRLYAISNVGSILGLLTYPFLIEPALTVTSQTVAWSIAFGIYALTATGCAAVFFKRARPSEGRRAQDDAKPTPWIDKILWVTFAACGSMLLLALTNQMCQDVPVVPFLWVVPLALYLLTFVITFDHSRWYRRIFAIPLSVVAVAMVILLIDDGLSDDEIYLGWQITIFVGAIFFGCLVCHGEVVRLKPPSQRLTGFYLAISLGGALGGIFVSLIAPKIFSGYWELHCTFLFLALLTTVQLYRHFRPQVGSRPKIVSSVAIVWAALLILLGNGLYQHISEVSEDSLETRRSFYGVVHVYENDPGDDDESRSLYHGRIEHGRQYVAPEQRSVPAAYYSDGTGVGAFFKYYSPRNNGQPIHIGVIGLGVGTLTTYTNPGDRIRFYEINPQIEDIAREYFTYLDDCKGEATVVLGDARISMEQELKAQGSLQFDLIVLDAFSGDSVPIHLLTVEALELYLKHLKPNGVLAFHISNLHIDLSQPVRHLVDHANLSAAYIEFSPDEDDDRNYYSDWVLASKDELFLDNVNGGGYSTSWYTELKPGTLWTDDYSNLLDVVFGED